MLARSKGSAKETLVKFVELADEVFIKTNEQERSHSDKTRYVTIATSNKSPVLSTLIKENRQQQSRRNLQTDLATNQTFYAVLWILKNTYS